MVEGAGQTERASGEDNLVVEDTVPLEKETLPLVEGAGPLHPVDGAVPSGVETTAALDHCERDDPVVEERTYQTQHKPPVTKMMRLVEPGNNEAPTKQRRGKGKRKLDGFSQGTLHHFFFKSINTKECTNAKTTTVEPRAMRKRKQETMVEDPMESNGKKSRRTMVDFDDISNETLGSSGNLLGAKSFSGWETTRRHLKGKLDLIGVEIKKDESRLPGELTTGRKNI